MVKKKKYPFILSPVNGPIDIFRIYLLHFEFSWYHSTEFHSSGLLSNLIWVIIFIFWTVLLSDTGTSVIKRFVSEWLVCFWTFSTDLNKRQFVYSRRITVLEQNWFAQIHWILLSFICVNNKAKTHGIVGIVFGCKRSQMGHGSLLCAKFNERI